MRAAAVLPRKWGELIDYLAETGGCLSRRLAQKLGRCNRRLVRYEARGRSA